MQIEDIAHFKSGSVIFTPGNGPVTVVIDRTRQVYHYRSREDYVCATNATVSTGNGSMEVVIAREKARLESL